MQIIQAPRASAIIYCVLIRQEVQNPWLLPADICPIVPITFLKAQVPFHLVDISAESYQMDQAETWVRRRPLGGILYVHTYGEVSTPTDFFAEIKNSSPGLMIIDDRCLCVPGLQADPASQADIQLYSTGYAKIVDLNIGGYAFLREDIEYRPANLPFQTRHYAEIETSYKQAVSWRTRFLYRDSDWPDTHSPVPDWDDYRGRIEKALVRSSAQRAVLNHIYRSMLPPEFQLPAGFQTWRFNICVEAKQRVLEQIFSFGPFASSHYASLAGIMEGGLAPHAENLAASVINRFNDHHFTADQAEQACKTILENLS